MGSRALQLTLGAAQGRVPMTIIAAAEIEDQQYQAPEIVGRVEYEEELCEGAVVRIGGGGPSWETHSPSWSNKLAPVALIFQSYKSSPDQTHYWHNRGRHPNPKDSSLTKKTTPFFY